MTSDTPMDDPTLYDAIYAAFNKHMDMLIEVCQKYSPDYPGIGKNLTNREMKLAGNALTLQGQLEDAQKKSGLARPAEFHNGVAGPSSPGNMVLELAEMYENIPAANKLRLKPVIEEIAAAVAAEDARDKTPPIYLLQLLKTAEQTKNILFTSQEKRGGHGA